MAKIQSEDIFYNILRWPVDACTRRMFRKIRTYGKENIPKDGVYFITPNHCNTLLDALVILQLRHRPTAFGARADIFRKPSTARILRWLRMVPMARFRDGLGEVKNNFSVFEEAADCVVDGVPFCVFPEGTHFPGYEVHAVKSGVFRMAEDAVQKTDKPVYILPVGLSYSDFYRPKPDIYIRIGKPIPAGEILALGPKERSEKLHDAMQELVIKPERDPYSPTMAVIIWMLSVILSPVILAAILLSCPIWLTSELMVLRLKDKAWANTTRFGCRLAGTIILTIVYATIAFIFLPWWGAITLVLFFWLAPNFFYQIVR